MEALYFGQNVRTAFAVGQARGAVLAAAGARGVPCFDYTPQQVKGAVCGSGRAAKDQVIAHGPGAARRCRRSRSPTTPPTRSPSAICHANHAPLRERRAGRAGRRRRDDRARRGRRRGPPRRPRRARDLGRRRLPARGVGRDAARRCRRSAAASRCTATSSSATTRSSSTASRPRRSATCSCCCSASRASARRSRSACSAAGRRASSSSALAAGDVARLQAVPGVGKRTAERIVVELREKVVPDGDAEPAVRASRAATTRGASRATASSSSASRRPRPTRCWRPPRARAPRSCSRARCGGAR